MKGLKIKNSNDILPKIELGLAICQNKKLGLDQILLFLTLP